MEGSSEPTVGGLSRIASARSLFAGRTASSPLAPSRPVRRIETDIRENRTALAQARRRARAMIANLKLPKDATLDHVKKAVQDYRGRTILVTTMQLRGTLTGLLIPFPDVDVVVGEERTSPRHGTHICLHEIGHLLLDDDLDQHSTATCMVASRNLLSLEYVDAELAPLLPPNTVGKVLDQPIRLRETSSDHLSNPRELGPEAFALELLQKLRLDKSTRGSGPLATAFGHRPTIL